MTTTALVALTLVHFIWQGALVALALSFALAATRGWSANARYSLGVTALALMVALPLGTALRLRQESIAREEGSSRTDDNATTASSVRAYGRRASFAVGAARSAGAAASPSLKAGDRSPNEIANTSPQSDGVSGVELTARIATWTNEFASLLVALWLVGVLLLSARFYGGWLRVRRLTTQGIAECSQATINALVCIAQRMGVTRPVALFESARVQVPTVVGWLRPVLLLPLSLESGLSLRDVELLLAHELAHIRRHDYLVNLLQTTIETILFYHPGVWWVSARVREEREHCCDDAAAALFRDSHSYASALLRLEEHRQQGPRLAMAANGASLVRRVRRLVAPSEGPQDARARWAAMPLGIGALVGLASWATADATGIPMLSRGKAPSAVVAAAETTRVALSKTARPDTVITYRGSATSLDARWSWAEGAARSASAQAVWIGYRVAGDPARGFAYIDHHVPVYTGNNGTMMGSMRFKGSRNDMTFLGVRMDSLVGEASPDDQVIMLGFTRRNGKLELDRVHAATFALPVHFAGRPLYWLGEANDEQSVEHVRRLYSATQGRDVRGQLIEVVGLHVSVRPVLRAMETWLGASEEIDTRRNAAGQLGAFESADALALAARVARGDKSRDVRREAVSAIGEMQVTGALDSLSVFARSLDDRDVRREAVEAIGSRHEPDAAKLLVRLVWDDGDEDVQRQAVGSLGETHDPHVAQELARIAREHPRAEVKREAVEALGELDEPAVALPLLTDIVEHSTSSDVRQEALEALGELKTDAAHRAVLGFARSSSDAEVGRRAIDVLAEKGDVREALDAISQLIWKGNDVSAEKRAIETLAELEGEDIVDSLVNIAQKHPSADVRRAAVEQLGSVEHDPRAQLQLAKLARSSDDESIARTALDGYVNSAKPADVIVLAKSLLSGSTSDELQNAALEVLGELDGNAGIPALIDIARTHPNRELRKRAINRLGDSDDPRAHAALAKLLEGGR